MTRQLALCILVCCGTAAADEAVTRDGTRVQGTLNKDGFLGNAGKQYALSRLSLVTFSEHPPPPARCRLLHQLLLAGGQQLAGELVALGPGDIRFRTAAGDVRVLSRRDVLGLIQADGHLTQWAEDFESSQGAAFSRGKPTLSEQHAFSGKRSLLLDAASGELVLDVAAAQKPTAPHRASVHFFDAAQATAALGKVRFVFQGQPVAAASSSEGAEASVTVLLDRSYRTLDGAFHLAAVAGWHLLTLDWHDGRARTYIDDFLLGEQAIGPNVRLAALDFSCAGKGSLWFDACRVTEVVSPVKRAAGPPGLDEIWLAAGEQVFGKLLQADERALTMETGVGKRTFSWLEVRGFFFPSQATAPANGQNVEVRYRSGPGVSCDQLMGTIAQLDASRLVLRHALLGELTIAREHLHRIRFLDPANP